MKNYLRKHLSSEPARRYLLHEISKSGLAPKKLPSERLVAEKLHCSRAAVRQAIQELEEDDYIIRLPQRKAAFSNPAKAAGTEFCIGIIVSQNYMGKSYSLAFSGLASTLAELQYEFHFSTILLADDNPRDTADRLEHSGLDCIVWYTQSSQDIPIINLLLKKHFPVFTICNNNFPEWEKPLSGWCAVDYTLLAREIAESMSGCKKIMVCEDNAELTGPLREILLHDSPDAEFLRAERNLPFEEYRTRILKFHPDALLLHLNRPLTQDIVEFLSGQETPPLLAVIPVDRTLEILYRKYPDIKMVHFDFHQANKRMFDLGVQTAYEIVRRLKTGAFEAE